MTNLHPEVPMIPMLAVELNVRANLILHALASGAFSLAESRLHDLGEFWVCTLFQAWEHGLDLVTRAPRLHAAWSRHQVAWQEVCDQHLTLGSSAYLGTIQQTLRDLASEPGFHAD